MANGAVFVLSIAIAVGILLVLSILFLPTNSVDVVNEGSQSQKIASNNNVIVSQVYDDSNRAGCLRSQDQRIGSGNCNYPINDKKKCYKIERRGCNEVKVEVSCFDELDQVKGDGKCFNLAQRERKCYNVGSGCSGSLSETSCFEDLDDVDGCPGYDCPVQIASNCEVRGFRVICG